MTDRVIEQELKWRDYILLQTTGISMEPLLHNRRSTVVIEKPPAKLKKYDVALFKRTSGEYVLHRVLKVRKKDYLICGDNGICREPVVKEQIIGVMTGFYPDEGERYVSCGAPEYRRYVRTVALRYGFRRIRVFLEYVRRKVEKFVNLTG